jgi:hypothetical protein
MTTNLKEMMDAANAAVPRITPAQAQDMVAQGNTLMVDVRDALEVLKSGKIVGERLTRPAGISRRPGFAPRTTRVLPRRRMWSSIAAPAVARRSAARFSKTWAMSAFTTSAGSRTGPKAAARWRSERRFRAAAFGTKRTSQCSVDLCFRGNSGHWPDAPQCPLMTHSERRVPNLAAMHSGFASMW